MAVYSQYSVGSYSGGEAIGIDESYIGAVGAWESIEESNINQHMIFEHILGCDFAEAMTNHGVMTESDFEAVNEASVGGIFSKVVEFFKKLGAKIMGIIQNCIDKITAMCTKDGKELVRKFEKKITSKLNSGEYDDKFTYKFCSMKGNGRFSPEAIAGVTGNEVWNCLKDVKLKSVENPMLSGRSLDEIMNVKGDKIINGTTFKGAGEDSLKGFKSKHDSDTDSKETRANKVDSFNDENNKSNKPLGSDDLSDYKDDLLSALIGENTDASSFSEDINEKIFDDEEEKEGLTNSDISSIEDAIKTHSKYCSKLEKEKKVTDKVIRDFIKEADKIDKELKKASQKKGEFTVNAAKGRVLASAIISMANKCNEASTMWYAAYLSAAKKHYKQCRSVYIKAATYTKKKAKNESALLEAICDVSDYEVDCMMPEC